jgi:hypothetical protein
MTQTDNLVAEYLARVERAAAGLTPARREELLRDLREHIDIERADSPDDSEAHLRTILDRLGDPEVIAAAADTPTGRIPAPPVPDDFVPAAPHPARAPAPKGKTWAWALAAAGVLLVVLFCLAAAFLVRSDSGGPPQPAEPAIPAPAEPADSPR